MTHHYPDTYLPIKSWAEEDRPREKMLLKGKHSLTEAELVAILLGSGNRQENALTLAKRLLASVEQDLDDLARLSLPELMKFSGIGQAKAVAIAAAMELGRRRQLAPLRKRPQVRSSKDAYLSIASIIADLDHEEFWLLLLNRANRILARERISSGGTAGTVVDAKQVFRRALEVSTCTSIILVHNHPSGNLQPSGSDLQLTRKLVQAGRNIDVLVLDHLIIGQRSYYSFADEGVLEDSNGC